MKGPLSQVEQKVMRAIVTREHRKATAERRAAQEKHKASTAPAPSSVGWSTKPGPKKRATAIELQLGQTRLTNRKRWAQQHPGVAAAERGLRLERAAIAEKWDHKREGTPETHEHFARRREGAMRRLYLSEAITEDQLGAAIEIAEVFEQLGRDVTIRTTSIETRIDAGRRHGDEFFEQLKQVRLEVTYSAWRLEAGAMIGPLLAVIAGDEGYVAVAARHGMGRAKLLARLQLALDRWIKLREHVKRVIHRSDLDAAAAGLAA